MSELRDRRGVRVVTLGRCSGRAAAGSAPDLSFFAIYLSVIGRSILQPACCRRVVVAHDRARIAHGQVAQLRPSTKK